MDTQIKKIKFSDIKILWCIGFYDFARSGLMEYNHNIYYFNYVDEYLENPEDEDSDLVVKFHAFELTKEELSKLLLSQLDFQQFVGNNNLYENNKRKNRNIYLNPKEEWERYYKNYERRNALKVDLTNKKPIMEFLY